MSIEESLLILSTKEVNNSKGKAQETTWNIQVNRATITVADAWMSPESYKYMSLDVSGRQMTYFKHAVMTYF